MVTDYDWYDPDKDIEETGGIKGMNLANAILERRNADKEADKVQRHLEATIGPVEPVANRRKRTASNSTYEGFLARATQIPTTDVGAMREALYTYFGRRFGPEGKTPIYDMEDWQVRGAFYGNLKTARQRSLE
tara:strand:+ start:1900 stop:2298 length:399 start_codon:yes stop_codon:yes gene_type:complete